MSARPFKPSWLSRRFAALAAASTRLSPYLAIAGVMVALVLVGVLDHATGPAINLVVFYLLIACFAAWSLGLAAGLAVGFVTVAMAAKLDGLHFGFPLPRQATTNVAVLWNTATRLVLTSVVVILAAGLRGALDLERCRAETDMLTGVLNKSAFLRGMESAIVRARRDGAAMVLAYLDLDGFKAINDRYGHAAGDAVLCTFADAGAKSIRRDDLLARFGGDEFVLLLTVPTCPQGDEAAEALHARLAEILVGTGYPVTCSMGALVLDAARITETAEMIEAADRLMYEVKHAGKNAIRVARADLHPRVVEAPPAATAHRRDAAAHVSRSAA